LPGGEGEGAAGENLEAHALDVVGEIVEGGHAAIELAPRMHRHLVGLEPGDGGVAPGRGAARQDQPARALLVREGEFRIGCELDLAGLESGFAGAAIPGAAAVGIGHALGERRLQNRLPGLDRDRTVVLREGDRVRHGCALSPEEWRIIVSESNCS
jgi:hypothetical protein